jgi:hypothetical protein
MRFFGADVEVSGWAAARECVARVQFCLVAGILTTFDRSFRGKRERRRLFDLSVAGLGQEAVGDELLSLFAGPADEGTRGFGVEGGIEKAPAEDEGAQVGSLPLLCPEAAGFVNGKVQKELFAGARVRGEVELQIELVVFGLGQLGKQLLGVGGIRRIVDEEEDEGVAFDGGEEFEIRINAALSQSRHHGGCHGGIVLGRWDERQGKGSVLNSVLSVFWGMGSTFCNGLAMF